jgi:hypothetical protein
VGILVAPPLAAALQIFAGQFMRSTIAVTPIASAPALEISMLQQRVEALQALVANGDEPPSPEVINLLDRLRRLIEHADHEPLGPPAAAQSQEITIWPKSSTATP